MSVSNIIPEKVFLRTNTKDPSEVFITEADELPLERRKSLLKLVNSIPEGEKIEKLAKELKNDISVSYLKLCLLVLRRENREVSCTKPE